MADSLRTYEILKSSLPEAQARAVTRALQQSESELALDIKSVLAAFVTKDELRAQLAEVRAQIADTRADLQTRIADTKAELMRWMFLFWIGQVAVTVGMMLTVVRMLK